MPAISDLSLTGNAGTVVFKGILGCGADGTVAQWHNEVSGETRDLFKRLSLSARDNAQKTGRKMFTVMRTPIYYSETTTGLKVIRGYLDTRQESTVPHFADPALVSEHFRLWGSAVQGTVFRGYFESGYGPT